MIETAAASTSARPPGYAILKKKFASDANLVLLVSAESPTHITCLTPHPEGKGAYLAMQRALTRANVPAAAMNYVNLHGTASKANDRVETYALAEQFKDHVPVSSTKGWTGCTRWEQAGILEAVIAMDTLHTGLVPGTLNREKDDPEFRFDVLSDNLLKNALILR